MPSKIGTRPARPLPRPIPRTSAVQASAPETATSLAPVRHASHVMETQPLPAAPHPTKSSRKRKEIPPEITTSPPPQPTPTLPAAPLHPLKLSRKRKEITSEITTSPPSQPAPTLPAVAHPMKPSRKRKKITPEILSSPPPQPTPAFPAAPQPIKPSRKCKEITSEIPTSPLPQPQASTSQGLNSQRTPSDPGPSNGKVTDKGRDGNATPTSQPLQPIKRTRKLTEKAQALQDTR